MAVVPPIWRGGDPGHKHPQRPSHRHSYDSPRPGLDVGGQPPNRTGICFHRCPCSLLCRHLSAFFFITHFNAVRAHSRAQMTQCSTVAPKLSTLPHMLTPAVEFPGARAPRRIGKPTERCEGAARRPVHPRSPCVQNLPSSEELQSAVALSFMSRRTSFMAQKPRHVQSYSQRKRTCHLQFNRHGTQSLTRESGRRSRRLACIAWVRTLQAKRL